MPRQNHGRSVGPGPAQAGQKGRTIHVRLSEEAYRECRRRAERERRNFSDWLRLKIEDLLARDAA